MIIWNPWHGCHAQRTSTSLCKGDVMVDSSYLQGCNSMWDFLLISLWRKRTNGENYDGARPCHYEWVK